MSIEAIGDGLKTTLSIAGLRVYSLKELPDKVSTPSAVMALGETEYHSAYGSPYDADFTIRLIILLGKSDTPSAANKMLDYIEPDGARSIPKEVEADPTLAASCQAAIVIKNLGLTVTNWGGVEYLSTEFEIGIWL